MGLHLGICAPVSMGHLLMSRGLLDLHENTPLGSSCVTITSWYCAVLAEVRLSPGYNKTLLFAEVRQKHPDGLTFILWRKGCCPVGKVTVADTTETSYLPSSFVNAGSAAESAASRKQTKYTDLTNCCEFVAIAIESIDILRGEGFNFSHLTKTSSISCQCLPIKDQLPLPESIYCIATL